MGFLSQCRVGCGSCQGPPITGGCVNLWVLLGDSGGKRIAALRQAHEDDAEFGYRLFVNAR